MMRTAMNGDCRGTGRSLAEPSCMRKTNAEQDKPKRTIHTLHQDPLRLASYT